MAADDPSHRRNQSANSIPLQDLNEDGCAPQALGQGLNGRESHRRTFSDRIANLRIGRRHHAGGPSSNYEPVNDRPHSRPMRASLRSPIAFVTSPSGEHEMLARDDDDAPASPVDDPTMYQSAIGFAGLTLPSIDPDDVDEELEDEAYTRRSPSRRPRLPSLQTNRDSIDDMVSVQLNDGPAYYSPIAPHEEDTQPLTDTSRLNPSSATRSRNFPQGQRHDRDRRLSVGRSSGFSGRFSSSSVRHGSRLGDDLQNSEAGASSSALSSNLSRRKASLSPASAESPLARTGTMLRKMSQRVVNVSNEQVDAIVERNIKRRSLRRPSNASGTGPSLNGHRAIDFAAVDGTSASIHSRDSEKVPSSVVDPEDDHEAPRTERNPLRGKSVGIFAPDSRVRQRLLGFLVHPFWEPFILLLIVIQTVILAVDAAHDVYTHPRPARWGKTWTDFALFAIFVVYTVEIILKTIVSGFIWNPREYSTIDRTVGVRKALLIKANELFALHRKPSQRPPRVGVNDEPDSLLRSFTSQTIEDAPGGSRQAQKKRLAHRAFLRHSFNRVDFIAVVSYWISFVLGVLGQESQRHLYVFQMLSCLRIVRLLGITSGTSVILRSLKRAAPSLLNVSFLIGFFWLLFAIIGVQVFKSSLRRTCTWDGTNLPSSYGNYTQNYTDGNGAIQYCGGWLAANNNSKMPWLNFDGSWGAQKHKGYICPVGSYCVLQGNPYNGTKSFDNILQSLENVFVIMSTNTFSDDMYDLMDTDYLASALYFAAGIVLLTFWLINLLIAVITSSFQVIREESRSSAFMAEETKPQKDDADGDEEIDDSQSVASKHREPRSKALYRKAKWFWIAVITYGLLVNCWRYDTMDKRLTEFISASELIVTLILLGEIVLRFLADWRAFLGTGMDWFDLGLAIITAVIELPSVKYAYQGQVYAWLSVFQIMRVYRIVLAVSITRELILLVLKHVSGVLNLILFVFLLTFLAALFAVQLFRGELPLQEPSGESLYTTFGTIFNAYLGMYQILSSENWTDVLYTVTATEHQYRVAWIGGTFLCLWFVIACFITLNMFIAVIQENFDVSEDQKRLQQVRMFLQQKELGHASQGTLSLSTIFKFSQWRRQDPLDYGSAATDMLLKDGIVKEFLDEAMEEEMHINGHTKTGLTRRGTFDITQGTQSLFAGWWSRMWKRIWDSEPNPFYSKLQLTKANEEVNPSILAKEVIGATELRKVTQREYLRNHPTYNVSLFIFQPENRLRRACQRIVGPGRGTERPQGVAPNIAIWYGFSAFIYVAIVAMVILACITTPLYQRSYFHEHHPYSSVNWFVLSDLGFAGLFTIEAVIKVIADGFFWTPNAYFRSSWGFIDGVVLLTLWISVITSLFQADGASRAVGAFKALRALRLLNVSDSARDTFHSIIIRGGWKVVSAALVSLSLLIPFAIYGLNLFSGKMLFCNQQNGNGNPINSPINIINLTDCVGEYYYMPFNWEFPAPRQVRNTWYNFDNFGESLFVLFAIVSQEGWINVMWSAQSITGIYTQPNDFASQANAIFFVVFNLLGAVFVLTLFVSVFMRNYTEQTGVAFLTTEQRSWLELRKLLRQLAPSKRPNRNKRRENWQEWCYRRAVAKTGRWQRAVSTVLILHLILLCLEWYPEPWLWERIRDFIFLGFTFVYVANIVIRIIGLSWSRFRRSAWDVYSIFSVSGTLITTVLLLVDYSERMYVQWHKLFLVSIALLLIPRNNQLDQLFKTAAASLTAIANLLATWFVLFLVYAIAMTQAFGLTRFSWTETGNINFRTVPKALILLFRMSVGEGWNQIMEDFARVRVPYCTVGETYFDGDCGSAGWARALFVSWNILSMYIFVNLFISLIYESFSYVYQRSSGLSVISREEIRRFKQAWSEFDPDGTGFISKEAFPRFLGELSGVFEMRIYDGDFAVRKLVQDCKVPTQRSSVLPLGDGPVAQAEVDIVKLRQRLDKMPIDQIRRRRARMNTFYEEVLVSSDPDRGISFNALLMVLAHYKVINDNKSLRLEEFLRRRARLQRVQETINRKIVVGFFDTLYWRRQFRRHMDRKKDARIVAVPNYGVPEIFVQDEEGDDVTEAKEVDVPSIVDTPSDRAPSTSLETVRLAVGKASAGSEAGGSGSSWRNRSGSIQSSVPSTPSIESPYLSPQHRPTASTGSIQPDWHFAAAMEPSSAAAPPPPSLTPPVSPGLPPAEAAAARSRANSAVSQIDMMDAFQDSAWGQSMRRSATQKRSGERRPSS